MQGSCQRDGQTLNRSSLGGSSESPSLLGILQGRKVFSLPPCCFQVTGRNVGVGTAPEKDSGSGESLDLSPPAPNPTLFPVPARAEFQQDLWKSRDHGVIQTWIWLCLGAPSALCSWVSNKSGAQNPRNCCWGSAGIREDLVWGIPVWGIKWGSAWIPVRAHRDWDFCPWASRRPQG